MIHGGTDGYLHTMTYLQCNTNNRAESVLNFFWKATRQYGVLSCVGSDKGGENIVLCQFMVSQGGIYTMW